MVASEVFHYLRIKNKGKRYVMALKVYMNMIGYRELCKGYYGKVRIFRDLWISWIMECIFSVSFNIIINCKVFNNFNPSRMIKCYIESGQLSGIKLSRDCLVLSHILFADDSLFFLPIDDANVDCLMNILQKYCYASDQVVNL